ncbi:DNA repair protein RadA, partial [bacterium]|nr:DNA repair protein RadA [bacterium]
MAKAKTIYVCQSCGASSPRWQGRCPSCGEWNTLTEERTGGSGKGRGRASGKRLPEGPAPRPLGDISTDDRPRITAGSPEFDRVLGGGFVPGSSVLVGGDPGVGKSTLLLQT